MAFQVVVKIDHNCDLIKLSELINKEYWVYCTGYFDFFIFKEDITPQIAESVLKFLNFQHDGDLADLIEFPNNIILPCQDKDRDHIMHFYSYLFKSLGIVFDLPLISPKEETYLYHCLDSRSHSQTLERLQKISNMKIESIKEYIADEYYGAYMFSISDVINELTDNQTKMIIEAYRDGYYDIPRQIRTQDLATKYDKSRYTIDKTIRSAEEKIMRYVYRFLR